MTRLRGDGRTVVLLTSFEDVFLALGGSKGICSLTGCSRQSVWNWRKAQRFPARHYPMMRAALTQQGCVADLHLWTFSKSEKTSLADDVAA